MMCMNRGSEGVRFAGATEQGRESFSPTFLPALSCRTGELKTNEPLRATT